MKAIVYSRYGSPDVLEFREIDKPEVGDEFALNRAPGRLLAVDWVPRRPGRTAMD